MEQKQEHKDNEFLPKRGNHQHETVTYEIGGTFYEVSTSCAGSELLYDKMKRLIKEESGKTPADKKREVRYNKDSNSIVNQKALLSKYATDNGFTNPVFFIDDGVSGVTFDRPNFNRMIAEIEAGNVGTVIVKDMSRLGRDYLKIGYYTVMIFMQSKRESRFLKIPIVGKTVRLWYLRANGLLRSYGKFQKLLQIP